ncbi:MAG: acyl-ACP--UDP-N-acetylglucosamine O-acyltransferase [bacterium]|nr:acyl-ACP--UDP-N-acetylglucosamine O-acyltransferase [bacterium]
MNEKTIIHPSAVVDPKAILGDGVSIGPFCCVGPDVVLGDRVRLVSHVSLDGIISIGEDSTVYPFASLGHAPQDLKYAGEKSKTIIGKRCCIREYVTIQPGTKDDKMKTVVGDDCLLMVGVHVAHDCVIGNRVIMSNNATLGGHVEIGDHAIIGGLAAVHQFVRIGSYAMIGGTAAVANDVIPYGFVKGDHSSLDGMNLVGMKRRGLDRDEIVRLRRAYKQIFETRDQPLADRVDATRREFSKDVRVTELIDFIVKAGRPLCLPEVEPDRADDAA